VKDISKSSSLEILSISGHSFDKYTLDFEWFDLLPTTLKILEIDGFPYNYDNESILKFLSKSKDLEIANLPGYVTHLFITFTMERPTYS